MREGSFEAHADDLLRAAWPLRSPSWRSSSSSAGQDEEAQPSIAGGYDLQGPNDCFGTPPAPADGQAAARDRPAPAARGRTLLRRQAVGPVREPLEHAGTRSAASCAWRRTPNADGSRPLNGDVSLRQRRRRWSSRGPPRPATRARSPARSAATKIAADLKRDPPDAGAAKPRAPGSIAGIYKLSPRSTCFGGKFELEGSGSSYTLKAREKRARRRSPTTARRAPSPATWSAPRAARRALKGQAVDRNINNLQLHPARRGRAHRAARRRRQAADDARRPASRRRREGHRDRAARVLRAPRRDVLHRRRRGHARGARLRLARGQARAAARDGRGRGGHHARPDHPRLDLAERSRPRSSPRTSSPRSASRPTSA